MAASFFGAKKCVKTCFCALNLHWRTENVKRVRNIPDLRTEFTLDQLLG